MKPFRAWVRAIGAAVLLAPLVVLLLADVAAAQAPAPSEKLNAYVGCINRLSERSYELRKRYFSWVSKNGPTGKERIIYGTYTIYDTSDCRKAVEKANGIEPRDAALEAAASAYVEAVGALEPLLKETADYYSQEDYKDDRMAKGRALHPRLVAAWDAFANADKALRGGIEAINDRGAAERLAEIESKEGRKARYHVQALMIQAKRVLRTQDTEKPDMTAITQALNEYEDTVKALRTASRRRSQGRLVHRRQRQVVSYLGKATDAPHPRQGALQPGRQDDAEQRRRLDGRGLAAPPAARLQSTDRSLQSWPLARL